MGNGQVHARKLVIKEGMTPQEVKDHPKATPQQKAFANIFDADGVNGYSAREAKVFNSTTITDNGKRGVTLWTQFEDGTRKGSTITGDVAAFKYAPQGEVKPFIKNISVKAKQNKQPATSESITTPNAPKFSEDLYKNFKDWSLETRNNCKDVVGHDSQGCLVKDYYFSSDRLFSRSRTKDGKEIEYREYNTDGSKHIIIYVQEDGSSVSERYYSSGNRLLTYEKTKDRKQVEYREYNPDGSIDKIRYVQEDGTKVREDYYTYGHKLFIYEKTKNGQDIEYREYNPDGSKNIIRYVQDDGTKVEEIYYENNRLACCKKTKGGKEVEYREYHPDGSLSEKRP